MSWLNFNESLSSIKGQLSNFASGVLNEGIVKTDNSAVSEDTDELSNQQETFTNIELQDAFNVENKNEADNWAWPTPTDSSASDPTSKDEIICNLQKKIANLENDKRELTLNLEQLDIDCQQTTDKLVTLKDNLQVGYDELRTDYENLKHEYTSVLNENMEKSKEIHVLKSNKQNEELTNLQEENAILNKQLMISLKEVESKNDLLDKYNALQKQCDAQLESLISEKLINEELQKLYKNLETVNASLNEKLKKYDNTEENEYEKINLQSTNLALYQDNLIAENEELCATNSSLKSEIAILRNENNICTSETNDLKVKLAEIQKLYDSVIKNNEDLNANIEENLGNAKSLKLENEKLTNELKLLENNNNSMNTRINQLTTDSEKLVSDCAHLKNLNQTLSNEYQQLKVVNEELKTSINPNPHNCQEKYIKLIHNKIKNILDKDVISSVPNEEDSDLSEFGKIFEMELTPLLILREKSELLEMEISELLQQKTIVLTEKNREIEKLLSNSEILSQEVIAKSQCLKEFEDECAELMKNNDLLITELDGYKKSNSLQTISESHEDNLLQLEIQLENANKRIRELELIVLEMENPKEDHLEVELMQKHLNMTSNELSQSKLEHSELLSHYKQLEEDKLFLKSALDKTKTDFENTEYKYTELTINFDSVKEEHEVLKNKHLVISDEYQNVLTLTNTLENKIFLLEQEQREIIEKLDFESDNSKDKDAQIKNFVEKLQNSKMLETSLKLQVDTLHKELQTVAEAKQNIEQKYELCKDEYERDTKTEQFTSNISHLEEQIRELTASRDDLVNLVHSKHSENVKYHEEIQRLNLHLGTQIEKASVLEKQLSELSVDNISEEEIIQRNEEIEKLKDQNSFLKEKCEVLAQNLLQDQSNFQKALQERQVSVDRETSVSKELERLRQHLVEIEDSYTQELLQAEQRNKEMLMKVNEIEQREKDSNSIYTSVNIRANQQVETLQTQLQLVTNQREELRVIVSELEDKENKQVAALTNLQLVLEQFQREKEKDIEQETERIRRQIGIEKRIQDELRGEIGSLKSQLEGSKQGLQAASRLSDQLEKSKQQICNYKDEILKLQEQLQVSETKCKDFASTSDTKVDKSLIKNLLLGYISSNSIDQPQILKVIATVLDFNQKESEKANLNKPIQGGWLSAILHPQSVHPNEEVSQQSLSEAFVRFLENESKPKVVPNLLVAQQSKDNLNAENGTTKNSPHTLQEIVLPTFEDFGSSRSSSSILKGILKNNT